METIFILFVLIVALTGLVGLRKENEEQLDGLIREGDAFIDLYGTYGVKLKENTELKLSNRSLKGSNTKHKETIEEMKDDVKFWLDKASEWEEKNQEQADTIKKLNCSLDESYIAINAVGNESNKKKRLEQLDKYMTK